MGKLKHFFIVLILFVFIIMNLSTIIYAEFIQVTDENLKTSFQKIASLGEDGKNIV